MEYPESFEQALEYAKSALARMQENSVPANPDNFTVWFQYFSGKNPDLKRAVDILTDNDQEFTDARNAEIYRKFFTSDDESLALNHAAGQIEAQLASIVEYMEAAGSDTAEFGKALETASGQIGDVDGAGDLKGIITRVLGDTREIQKRNSNLEQKLKASSQEVSQLKDDLEDMRREALTDALTAIPNRKQFDMELRRAATESMEHGDSLSLLMLDIDYFKKFNDNYGHQVGDKVLRLLAATMTSCIKGQDTAARYGGEEFSVILPRTGLEGAVRVAEMIRQRVSSKKVVNRKTGEDLGLITVSIGAGVFRYGEPLSQLISRTDEALYMAKDQGRNRVVSESEIKESELAFKT